MNLEKSHIESINTLINGVRTAQSRGVYSLEEAESLSASVRTVVQFFNSFVQQQSQQSENQDSPQAG